MIACINWYVAIPCNQMLFCIRLYERSLHSSDAKLTWRNLASWSICYYSLKRLLLLLCSCQYNFPLASSCSSIPGAWKIPCSRIEGVWMMDKLGSLISGGVLTLSPNLGVRVRMNDTRLYQHYTQNNDGSPLDPGAITACKKSARQFPVLLSRPWPSATLINAFPSPQHHFWAHKLNPETLHSFLTQNAHSRSRSITPDPIGLNPIACTYLSLALSLASSHMLPLPLSRSLRLTLLVLCLHQPYTT